MGGFRLQGFRACGVRVKRVKGFRVLGGLFGFLEPKASGRAISAVDLVRVDFMLRLMAALPEGLSPKHSTKFLKSQ